MPSLSAARVMCPSSTTATKARSRRNSIIPTRYHISSSDALDIITPAPDILGKGLNDRIADNEPRACSAAETNISIQQPA
jgi:hypothetical protein